MGMVGVAMVGAGCMSTADPEQELGFTIEETASSGAWEVVNSGNVYEGDFANEDILTYHTVVPNVGPTGRGATWLDVVGYRQVGDGTFEFTFNGKDWNSFNEDDVDVIGETLLQNGMALVLGPTDCDPSPACYSGSGWMAIINTPQGVTPGGVFESGEDATLEGFKNALAGVSIVSTDYRSTLKSGNFTFSIPEGAVAVQTDAGGKSAISIYQNEDFVYQAESVIYSVQVFASSEFETGESYSFEEWLEREGVTLTGHSSMIGGLEFHEGHRGDAESVAFYHYVEQVENQPAYVWVVPSVRVNDAVGKSIQDSLNFNPTEEELKNAQAI